MVDGEDKVARIAILPQFPIEPRSHINPDKGIDLIGNHRAHRTECVESLCSGPLTILLLQVSCRDIVGDGVAADIVACILMRAEVPALLSNDDGKFSFEIHALRE